MEDTIGRMKERAPKETTSITNIYSREVVNTRFEHPDIATGLIFPSLYSLDASLYRERSKNYPALPKSLLELSLSEEQKLTKHGRRFLLVDEIYKSFFTTKFYFLSIYRISCSWSTTYL